MLDLKFVVAHADLVKQNCVNRNVGADIVAEVDRVVALDAERKGLLAQVEDLRRRQNEVAQATGKEKDPGAAGRTRRAGQATQVRGGRQRRAAQGARRRDQAAPRPRPQPDPPRRPDRRHRGPERRGPQGRHATRTFDFPVKDHVILGKELDLIDFEAGGKVAGTGFYFLKNDAVLLELALQQFALAKLARAGFAPIITPDLAQELGPRRDRLYPPRDTRRRSTRWKTPT